MSGNPDTLDRYFVPTEVIKVGDQRGVVAPIFLQSQGEKIDNPLKGAWKQYAQKFNYEAWLVNSIPSTKDRVWGAFAEVVGEFLEDRDGTVFDLGTGPGTSSRMVLEKSKRVRVMGFDVEEEWLRQSRENLAEFAGRAAYLQADLTRPLSSIPDEVATLSLAHWVTPYLSKEGQKVMYGEQARVLGPKGVFLTNNLEEGVTYNEMLKRFVGWEMQQGNAEGVAEFAKMRPVADLFDEGRKSGAMYPATVTEQMGMLKEVGFGKVERVRELTHPSFDQPFSVVIAAYK